ncbi:MAG TPA: DUF4870 domain-containing protein [Rhodocyclaceae bacterium]|nr:DUF4870 domain-containing protein [Rhodocyclaceae bacterium]
MNDETNNAVSTDSRNMAVLMFILSIFFGFIPGLIFFLIKKDDAFVYRNAVELLNFEITVLIAWVVLTFIPILGWILLVVLWIGNIVLLIMGALKVKEGQDYTFPFALRLLK